MKKNDNMVRNLFLCRHRLVQQWFLLFSVFILLIIHGKKTCVKIDLLISTTTVIAAACCIGLCMGRDPGVNTWATLVSPSCEHHQCLFIHEIVSFYMVFLGIVFKTRLKYSKELLTIMLKIQKLTLLIIRVTMGHGVLK